MWLLRKAVWWTGLLFISTSSILLISKSARSQGTDQATVYERLLRTEIPARSDNETYRLIPCGEKGVILFYKSIETVEQDKVKWYFTLYDKDLQPLWTKSIGLVNTLEYKDFSIDSDTLCFLFQTGSKIKEADFNFHIVRLTLKKGVFRGNIGKFPENSELIEFIVFNNLACFGINVKNEPARLMIFDLQSGNQNTIPLGQGSVNFFTRMFLDPARNKIYTVIRKNILKNLTEFTLSVFEPTGKLISEININSTTPEHNLNAIQFLPVNEREILIAGTYGSPPSQKGSLRNQMPGESAGFFFSRIYDNQQQGIAYYNFLELKNYSHLITDKNLQNLKKKSAKKDKDTDGISVDLKLLLHPLVTKNGYIILMAESFFPQYHTESFTDYDFYGRPFTNTYSVFDGYRFTNSIMAGFDASGKLIWDNSIEIHNLLSFELSPKVTWFDQGKNIIMAYQSDGKIASKIISQNEIVEKLDYTPVDLAYPNDKLLSETKSMMVPWYDRFFLCYGYQEIKNVALERNNKRLVFYFNKIRFD